MDPDQPRATFDDAPPFYFAFEVGDDVAAPGTGTAVATGSVTEASSAA